MNAEPITWTIVVAGGSGARFGRPKQFEVLDPATGERVIDRSIHTAGSVSDGVVVVVPAALVETERERCDYSVVAGGPTRSSSVRSGLAAVPTTADIVCVHDAARPLASRSLYRRLIGEVHGGVAAVVPGLLVADTIKVVDNEGVVIDTPDRAALRAVQTPQVFQAELLRRAHHGAPEGSDDGVLIERLGGVVRVADGEPEAFKITVPADLERARDLVASAAAR